MCSALMSMDKSSECFAQVTLPTTEESARTGHARQVDTAVMPYRP